MQGLRQRGQGEWGRGDAAPFLGAKIFFSCQIDLHKFFKGKSHVLNKT